MNLTELIQKRDQLNNEIAQLEAQINLAVSALNAKVNHRNDLQSIVEEQQAQNGKVDELEPERDEQTIG